MLFLNGCVEVYGELPGLTPYQLEETGLSQS